MLAEPFRPTPKYFHFSHKAYRQSTFTQNSLELIWVKVLIVTLDVDYVDNFL